MSAQIQTEYAVRETMMHGERASTREAIEQALHDLMQYGKLHRIVGTIKFFDMKSGKGEPIATLELK